jgi:hypothetical protein
MQNVAKEIEQRLGIGVIQIGFEAVCRVNADGDKARRLAARWKSAARGVAAR